MLNNPVSVLKRFDSIRQPHVSSINSFISAVLLLGLAAAPFIIWLQSVGDIRIYIDYETPPGQVAYLFSKLAGLYAVLLLWLQVVLALFQKTPFAAKVSFWSVNFHRNLGIATFLILLLHVSLFITAVSLRKDHFSFRPLLPNFSQGFYDLAVTLGVLALYGLLFVIITGYLRKRGISIAKWLHCVSVLALVLALIHCLWIGTETRYYTMVAVYSFMTFILIAALYYRGIFVQPKRVVK